MLGDHGSDGCGEPIPCLGTRGACGELGEGRPGGMLLGGSKVDEGLLGGCRLLLVTALGVPLAEGDEQEDGGGERRGDEVAVPAGGRGQQRPSGLTQGVGGSVLGSDGGAVGAVEGDGCRLQFWNIAANACVKVSAFGLDPLLDLSVGAYGADALQRPDLVAVARERAHRLRGVHHDVPAVLVGDTPRDVEAALAAGSGIIAVASGLHSPEELASAGASEVLTDLTDTTSLLRILESFAAR
ncbi:HAD hydrolase-like protein [Streptomyces sp. NBC_01429]|uniref:HAD hydrolase-like protein n=1 Tax=Streptomyces sp. NBC_01429 TaxID=2903862 RepID=UPI002E293BD1|nr:HAD hydrolase-like protein [Streptomyces sp. NBC_01429]